MTFFLSAGKCIDLSSVHILTDAVSKFISLKLLFIDSTFSHIYSYKNRYTVWWLSCPI